MEKREIILRFIDNFSHFGKDVENCFKFGNCFWFAEILFQRFGMAEPDPWQVETYYNEIDNHFACEIDGKLYDITGEITDRTLWRPWLDYIEYEPANAGRIIAQCIRKDYNDYGDECLEER